MSRIQSVIYSNSTAAIFKKVLEFYCPPPQQILDCTAGFRRMWWDIPYVPAGSKSKQLTLEGKQYYEVTFLDIREDCKPDIVGSFFELDKHVPPEAFDVLIFDPPWGSKSKFKFSYKDKDHHDDAVGELYGELRQFEPGHISLLSEPFSKVLRKGGTLIIKIADRADCFFHIEFAKQLRHFKLFDIVIFQHQSVRTPFAGKSKYADKCHGYFMIFKR